MGFGGSSKLHTAKVLRLSFDLPMVVEIVDTEAKINEFLPTLDAMMVKSILRLALVDHELRYPHSWRLPAPTE